MNPFCTMCDLCRSADEGKRCIEGIGNENAQLMIITDYPTQAEYSAQEPIVGADRTFLFNRLKKFNYDLRDCFMCHTVRCYPGTKKGKFVEAKITQARKCRIYLEAEIFRVKPKIIMTLGLLPLKSLMNDNNLVLYKCIGQQFVTQGIQIIPNYSLRQVRPNLDLHAEFDRELKKVIDLLTIGRIEVIDRTVETEMTDDRERILYHFEKASNCGVVYSDVETNSLDPYSDDFRVTVYGAAYDGGAVNFLPEQHPELYKLFLSLPQIVHNASFEGSIYPSKIIGDTMILAHLKNPTLPVGLEAVARRELGELSWKAGDISREDWRLRNAQDIVITRELYKKLINELDAERIRLHNEIVLPAGIICGRLYKKKLFIDKEYQAKLRQDISIEKVKIMMELSSKFHFDGNPNSTEQVGKFMYGKLGLPIPKQAFDDRDGKHSTAARFMAELGIDYEFPRLIRRYRELQKLESNYLYDGVTTQENLEFIRPRLNICGTVTGRPSARDGLQTFPRIVRPSFKSSRGAMASGDLSQIELVVGGAICAADPTMLEIFRTGGDIHWSTARRMAEVAQREATKQDRTNAKPVNFGLIYGAHATMLRQIALVEYDILFSHQEAMIHRAIWFQTYSGVGRWHEEKGREIVVNLCSRSPLGRYYPHGKARDKKHFDQEKRHALNYGVQGTGADLNNLGLIAAYELDPEAPIMPLHDQVYCDVYPEDAIEFAHEHRKLWLKKINNYWPPEERRNVPINVGISWGMDMSVKNELN